MAANRYMSRRPSEAVVYQNETKRRCAWCGDCIDPIDWCPKCTPETPCASTGGPHRRLRKRADAAYCDVGCRSAYARDMENV